MTTQWKVACWMLAAAFLLWIVGLFLVPYYAGADDTYYNTYSYQCDIAGDGECTWVMTDTTEDAEECPILWNTYDQKTGVLVIKNVRMKMDSMAYELGMVIFWHDPLTRAFVPVMSE